MSDSPDDNELTPQITAKNVKINDLKLKIVSLFNDENVVLTDDIANLLSTLYIEGTLSGTKFDEFIQYCVTNKVLKPSFNDLSPYIDKCKLISLQVLNCFDNITKLDESLPAQSLYCGLHEKTFFPSVDDISSAFLLRYNRALQRLKFSRLTRWWSDDLSSTNSCENKMVCKPVDYALGISGMQYVVGALKIEYLANGNVRWFLEDALQSIILDFSLKPKLDSLFVHGNIVVVYGEIKADKKLIVFEIHHPPNSELFIKNSNISHDKFADSNYQRTFWLVFGFCHLDNPIILSNIYAIIQNESFEGIIFVGNFSSKRLKLKAYRQNFFKLTEKLSMCSEALTNKTLVFIPGIDDPGLKLLPKLPLPNHLYTDMRKLLNPSIKILFASNPSSFETNHLERTRRFVVSSQNLIKYIELHKLYLNYGEDLQESLRHNPCLPSMIVNMIMGQEHLYPIPVVANQKISIAPNFDLCLHLNYCPNVVILLDELARYKILWNNRIYFINNGQLKHGFYAKLDLLSNEGTSQPKLIK